LNSASPDRFGSCYSSQMSDSGNKYRFLPHTADVKVQAEGITREEAFANAAMALKEAICGAIKVGTTIRKRIEVEGVDEKALLCAFLEEFLYLLDAESFLLSEVRDVKLSGGRVVAEALGDDAGKYDFRNSVKAVTYSEMFIRNDGSRWLVQFVLDV